MADEQIVTNIVATSDFSSLIADVQRTSVALSKLQSQLTLSNTALASQAGQIQKGFGETLRSTGQFTSHFVTVGSEVDRFGKSLDSGRLKLRDYFKVYQDHTKTSSGLIRGLAKEQVALQQSIVQSLGKSADGMQKFNVHVKTGLDEVANKTALAKKEMQIYNKVIQDGGNQIINWGKNTQWAGRQLTVGLTVPIVAFGVAASKAFRDADQELVRLTKVYGGLAATSKEELAQVRRDVAATAKELAAAYGASYKDTISLAADIAATGKQGNELLNSTREATRLSILGEVDRQDAMKATLAIQSAFKQNTDQLTESINFLNAVENQTSTSLADLVEAIPKAGPVVKALGGDVEDLALYLTAMREGGINASEGANALKSALASIINPTKVAREQFMGFGIDLSGIVNKNAGNLTATILEIQAALETLDPLKKSQAIEQLFGKFQFARMNALFENLGKQGSQTLQVLDLMKASSQDLASVAGRELGQITESASGKYRRALESLKAELAKVGEQFLTVQTFFVQLVDKILKFVGNLPDPIKKVLTLLAGFTAAAGPLIMLTGVFANFFGYIIKGVGHLRALFKGGEGFKLLTPQIVAANQAGTLIEKTFYSDAKAATTLAAALSNLNNEFNLLYNKANNVMPVSPAISTMANSIIMPGGDRVVNKQSQYLGKPYSRDMSHMIPSKESQAGSIFGVLPGTSPVNKRISNNPQIYAAGDLPDVPGLTSINNVSTGVVAAQAAKWHSMTAAIAMQSDVDLAALRQEVAATGTITSELSTSYQALLPKMNEVIQKAVKQSELIVMEAKAGKISLEQSKARIVALNAEIEALLASTAQGVASAQGKVINVGMVPLTSQMAVDPKTGKSNMKEMFHKSSNANLINKIAGVLGVRTSGGGYSTQTTKPRQLNDGGYVYTMNDGNIVPGPSVNADVVPAMLTPGEFVVNRESAQANLPLLTAINGGNGMGGPGYITGGQIKALQGLPTEFLRRINLISGVRRADSRSGRQVFSSGALNYDQMGSRPGRNSVWDNPILAAGRPGPDEVAGHIYSNNFYSKFGKSSSGSSPRATAEEFSLLTGLNIPRSRTNYAGQYDILPNQFITLPESFNTKLTPKIIRGINIPPSATKMDWFANPRRPEHMLSLMELLTSQGIPPRRALGVAQQALNRINSNIARLPDNAIITERIFGNIVTNSTRAEMRLLASRGNLAQSQQEMSARSLPRGRAASGPLASLPKRNRGGMIRGYNNGGIVRGYNKGGEIIQGSGMGTAMTGMGLMMGGSMVPGMVGQGMTFAGMAMQMAPMLKMMTPMIKGMGTFAGMLSKARTAATALFTVLKTGLSIITGPIGLISLAIGGAISLFLKLKKDATDAGEVNRATFGLTGTALEEVGIKYKTVGQRIKEVNQQLELNKAKVEASYQTYTKSGVAGLDITLKALNDGIANAKKEDTESVGLFDKAKSGQVNQLAASMKAQYVSLGMSVQEATNQIYILIKASNKSSQALSAISSDSFKAISDQSTAAMHTVEALSNVLASGDFNAEEFSRGLDNMLNSLVKYRESLMETNKNQVGLTQLESTSKVIEKILKLKGNTNKIEDDNLKALKQQNIEMALMLGESETLASVYAKYELYLRGASAEMNLMALSADQAVLALQGYDKTMEAAGVALKDTKVSKDANQKIKDAEEAEDILKKAGKQDDSYINAAIKNKEKLIRKLEEERSARLKILELQEKSQNFETQIQQAQLRYADAIAAGDMSQAAREQLNIQKLVADKERDNARQSINDKADKERKKLELEIEKLQAQKDAQAKALSNAQATVAKKQEAKAQAEGFLQRIKTAIATFGGDNVDDVKQFQALINEMREKGEGAQVNDLLDRYANKGNYQAGSNVYATVLKGLQNTTRTELKDPKYDKFDAAVEAFKLAVDKFVEDAPLDPIKRTTKPRGNKDETSAVGGDIVSENGKSYIYDEFGIKHDITSPMGQALLKRYKKNAEKKANGGYIKHYNPGGTVSGPGTGTSDSIPAYLSNGEYVIRASAVQQYGKDFFDRANAQKLATGGSVEGGGKKLNAYQKFMFGAADRSDWLDKLFGIDKIFRLLGGDVTPGNVASSALSILGGGTATTVGKFEALNIMRKGIHRSSNPNLIDDLKHPLQYKAEKEQTLGNFTHFSIDPAYQGKNPRYGFNEYQPKLDRKAVIAILKSRGFASTTQMQKYGVNNGMYKIKWNHDPIQDAIADGFIGTKFLIGMKNFDDYSQNAQFAPFFTGIKRHPLGKIEKRDPNKASGLMKALYALPNKVNQIKNQSKVNSMIKNGMWHGSQPQGFRGEEYLQGKNILEGAETHDPFYGMGFFGTSSKSEADMYASGYNSLNNWGESFGSLNQITKAPKGKYVDFTKGTNSIKWQNYELAKALGIKKNEYLGQYMKENLGDVMNSKGMTGAIMNRINAGRAPKDIQDAKWLGWNNPTGVHTIQRAMGGIVGPNYNVPSKTTSVANMPFGRYNQGGMVNNYGGFNIHANPGMDEKMLAKYVMAEIRTENAKSFASQGRPGARLMS
jgi:TP901 family phage tail tape measure protein